MACSFGGVKTDTFSYNAAFQNAFRPPSAPVIWRKRHEMETVESCRSPGIVPADLVRPVPLVETRPACATTGYSAARTSANCE